MSEYWILTRALLKNNYQPLKKNGKGYGRILGMGVLLVFSLGMFGFLMMTVFDSVMAAGQPALAAAAALLMLAVFVIFTVLFVFPNAFFFAKDLSTLLPLPVKAGTITAAKGTVVLVTQIPDLAIIVIPFVISALKYNAYSGFSLVLFVLLAVLEVLSVFFVLGSLTILVMSLMPSFANKDRFNTIVSLLTLVLAVGGSVAGQYLGQASAGSQEELGQLLLNSAQIVDQISGFIVSIPFAVRALNGSWMDLLISLLIPALLGLLFLLISSKLYLRSAAASTASSGSRKKEGGLRFVSRPAQSALFLTNLRIINRTPAYLTNMVIAPLLMPLVFLVMALVIPVFQELRTLLMANHIEWILQENLTDSLAFAVGAGLLFTLFFGSTNFICATAISRMGETGLACFKTLPVPLSKKLGSILQLGLLFTLLDSLLIAVPILYVTNLPAYWILPYMLGVIPASILICGFGLALDIIRPKLVWDDETASIKNNMNSVIEMFACWLIAGLGTAFVFVLPLPAPVSVLCLFVLTLAAGIFLWHQMPALFSKYLTGRR